MSCTSYAANTSSQSPCVHCPTSVNHIGSKASTSTANTWRRCWSARSVIRTWQIPKRCFWLYWEMNPVVRAEPRLWCWSRLSDGEGQNQGTKHWQKDALRYNTCELKRKSTRKHLPRTAERAGHDGWLMCPNTAVRCVFRCSFNTILVNGLWNTIFTVYLGALR